MPAIGPWDSAFVPVPVATAFATYAAPFSLVGRFGRDGVPGLLGVPFDTRTVASDPAARSASFSWVRAGFAKPIVRTANAPVTLRRAKVSGLTVATREVMRMAAPRADAHVRDVMARALGLALDRSFVDPTITATDSTPASITSTGTLVGSSSARPPTICARYWPRIRAQAVHCRAR